MLTKQLQTTLDGKLWSVADRIIEYYKRLKYTVHESVPLDLAYPFKLHFVCKKKYITIGIEIRERCNVESFFENFVTKCQAGRVPAKIYFAVPEKIDDDETIITHTQRRILKERGIGLLIVKDDGSVIEDIGTINCSRRFVLEPGSSLGVYLSKVQEIISKYNNGQCLDAVRDLCEVAEKESFVLAKKAIKKNRVAITISDLLPLNWEDVINILSIPVYKGVTQTRIITDAKFTNTLKSFKDKRNLSDHHKTAKQIRALEEQYPEAMLEGIRVIRQLVKIRSAV